MGSAVAFLLPALFAAARVQAATLEYWIEASPEAIQLGDPLFLRVSVNNYGDEPVKVPLRFSWGFANFFVELQDARGEYVHRILDASGSGGVEPSILPARATRVVAYEIIEMPRVDHFSRGFWSDIAAEAEPASIRVHLRHNSISQYGAEAKVRIRQRPNPQMERLRGLYTESTRRRREQWRRAPVLDNTRPRPGHFGLCSLSSEEEIVGALLSIERELPQGPLRDVLHLTKMMRAIYDSQDEAKRKALVRELLTWLDSLPEIERHCLAMEVISWCASCAPWEPAFFALTDGVIDRLPERCFDQEDYRGYWRRQRASACPPFRQYLQQKPKSASREKSTEPLLTAFPRPAARRFPRQ